MLYSKDAVVKNRIYKNFTSCRPNSNRAKKPACENPAIELSHVACGRRVAKYFAKNAIFF